MVWRHQVKVFKDSGCLNTVKTVSGSVFLCDTQVLSASLQCLKPQDCQDDVHAGFAQLLSEFNKAGAPYSLSVANRLYGEKSYQFVEVCEWIHIQPYNLLRGYGNMAFKGAAGWNALQQKQDVRLYMDNSIKEVQYIIVTDLNTASIHVLS